ncbi:MAG: hypothetical protein AUK47_13190 [Deltaproteobacteria bacterium CG2_30_63_29]|nr:MAG: hypothetical protein AUK47_13190 [Deltaproteobacteria bacterium CG2_30_63_29]
MSDPQALIDTAFASKFRVLSLVAEGSQAYVYRAFDTVLERPVALKILFEDSGGEDSPASQRLRREAVALARIAHPNTPTVFEAGIDPDTQLHYVVMEWIPGGRLSNFVDLPLSEDQLLNLAADISAGMSEAHRKGILHRDLRPDNVLVTTTIDGKPVAKVVDFGVAQFDETYDLARLTAPDEVMGALAYISPEQARGEPVSAETDVYAFGTILYEFVCGQTPHGGSPVKVISAHLEGKRPTIEPREGFALSPILKAIIRRCLEVDPAERFADCSKVHEVISNVIRERPTTHPEAIHAVTVDRAAKFVVVGRANGRIDVYNQANGLPITQFNGHKGAVTALTFRPDTEEFLSAGEDGQIHLWSITEACRAGTWPGIRGRQSTLEFSPFGYIFASGEVDGRIRLWSLLEQRPLGELLAHQGPVTALHFLPEGRFLASGGLDGTLLLWDIGSLQLAERCRWNRGPVAHLAMHVAERFVVAFQDGSLAMGRWNQEAPTWHRHIHDQPVSRLFEQHGGQGVFSVGLDGAIHCIDVFDGDPRCSPVHHIEGIRAAVLHPQSERLFASSDSLLMRWTWDVHGNPTLEGFLPAERRTGWVTTEPSNASR